MKITILGTLPPITGISPYCLEQANSLSKLVDIQFINFNNIYPKLFYKWTIKEKVTIPSFNKKKAIEIVPIINWYNPLSWILAGFSIKGEILHFHWWTFYLFPMIFTIVLIAKIRKRKIVSTIHNISAHESNILDLILSKIILTFPQKLIVHSSEMKTSLISNFKIDSKKVKIIPHGPLNFYKECGLNKNNARKKINLDKNAKAILFFGAIREYKGVDVLIKAFSKIEGHFNNIRLIIAGECWVDWSSYERLIDKLGLKNKIILKTEFIPTSEIKYFFNSADLLVMPYTHFESQTSVGSLGLAFGKAMVVTKVGGLPKLVKDKKCIVKPNNPNDLAKAMLMVLKNERLQKQLEKDSVNLALELSWDKIAKKTLQLYRSLKNNTK